MGILNNKVFNKKLDVDKWTEYEYELGERNGDIQEFKIFRIIYRKPDPVDIIKEPKMTEERVMELITKSLKEFAKEFKKELLVDIRDIVNQEVQDIRDDVKTLKEDVKDLKADVKQLKEDVETLKSDVEILKSDVKQLKEDVEAIKNCPTVKKELEENNGSGGN